MLKVYIRRQDGSYSTDSSPQSLSAALRDPAAQFWMDLSTPNDEELSLLDDVFGFHPLAIEDVIQYSQRPKIESYNHLGDACRQGYFFMVIHGPDLATFKENLRTKELDLFVSERYLVTVHEESMKTLIDLQARADVDPRLVLDPGIDMLLHTILDHMVDYYMPIFDYLQDNIDELEDQALTNPHMQLLLSIAGRKRDLLNLRRIIGPQRDVLAQLTRGEVPFIREGTRIYLRDVLDHLNRTVESIELFRDLIAGARDIYLSSVSNNLNQIMKTLTIFTVVALPITLMTSFFGMNFEGMPLINSQWGFWAACVAMLGMMGFLLYLFRRHKWL